MNLEDFMLNEIRTKYCMILLYKVLREIKFIETQSRMVVAKKSQGMGS